jgi:hypothetical protein
MMKTDPQESFEREVSSQPLSFSSFTRLASRSREHVLLHTPASEPSGFLYVPQKPKTGSRHIQHLLASLGGKTGFIGFIGPLSERTTPG